MIVDMAFVALAGWVAVCFWLVGLALGSVWCALSRSASASRGK